MNYFVPVYEVIHDGGNYFVFFFIYAWVLRIGVEPLPNTNKTNKMYSYREGSSPQYPGTDKEKNEVIPRRGCWSPA
jgi:hypothetical protein